MIVERRRLFSLGLAAIAALALPRSAMSADSSVAAMENYGARLVDTMKQAAGMSIAARYQRLTPIMSSAFDFGTMTRLIVGPGWSSIPGGQQAALRSAFTRFITAYYANRINGYSGQKFEVDPTPVAQGGGKIVKTKMLNSSGSVTQINYLMNGSRVIDIYFDGTVSEVAARRSEFAPILASGGAEGLIKALQEKSATLLAG